MSKKTAMKTIIYVMSQNAARLRRLGKTTKAKEVEKSISRLQKRLKENKE